MKNYLSYLANTRLIKKYFKSPLKKPLRVPVLMYVAVVFTTLALLSITSCTIERPPIRPSKNLTKSKPAYYDFLARKYYNQADYDKAIFQYKRLLTTFSNQPQWQKDLAWTEYEIGYTYYRMGESELAVEHFNRVISRYDVIAPRVLAQNMIKKINTPQVER